MTFALLYIYFLVNKYRAKAITYMAESSIYRNAYLECNGNVKHMAVDTSINPNYELR